jgi:hypothetical protein
LRITKENCIWPFRTKGVECWHPVQYSSMTRHVRIQLLTLEHCWSISTASCLTTLPTALILLQATSSSDWPQLSRFYPKPETESSLRNIVFWKINRMVLLDKDRMMDNVQKHNIWTTSCLPTWRTG